MATHSIAHMEIVTNDPEQTGQFFAKLFGWNVGKPPEMDYMGFQIDGGQGGASRRPTAK